MGHWKAMVAVGALLGGLVTATGAVAAPSSGAGNGRGPGYSPPLPPEAPACGAPAAGFATCHAVQLEYPSQYWHPGPMGRGPGSVSPATSPPSSGYYPGDLLSAYGLAAAAAAVPVGSGPTVAVVDAYDDPNAASDLATYRSVLSGAIDPNTGLADPAIPPLCSSTVTSGCVTFNKVNQTGGTSYPSGNTGWAEEISLDLDMISAICPNCNITLVEASTNSFSNLEAAVSYATSLHPAAVTNSYGGAEFSSESQSNPYYSASSSTAMTAATGDGGYGVEFPAASPGLTAVGGTSLTYSGTGSGLAWNPQTVWSSSTSSGAGSGCSAYEAMPAWQDLQGVYDLSADCAASASSGREVGDVSAVADPYTGVAVYDTYSESGWMVFGGTSASTQIIGAVYALAAGNGGMAGLPSALYTDTASGGGLTPGLVPVLSGSNGSCGDYLCTAGTGELTSDYNGPTGLGTPSGVSAFLSGSTTSNPGFSLSASPTSQTVTPGASASYTVDVNPSGGFSGSVTLSVTSGLPSGATTLFNPTSTTSSSVLGVTTSSSTPAGTYTLTITGTSGSTTNTTTVTLSVQAQTQTIAVSSITYATSGPHGANLDITVSLSPAVANATVSIDLDLNNSLYATGSGSTGSKGTVTFVVKNAPKGTYTTTVTGVAASGYTWSGSTPPNSYSKK